MKGCFAFMKLSSIRQAAKNVPLRRVWQTAEKAHAICGKPTAALFTDMLRCAKRYGAGPTDYMMFEFYDLNDAERSTYLTRVRSAAFVRRVNNRTDAAIFNDKNAFFEKFRPLMGREALNLFTADAEQFKAFLADKDAVIVKPIDGDCGSGIEKLYKKDFDDVNAMWAYVTGRRSGSASARRSFASIPRRRRCIPIPSTASAWPPS